MDRRFPLPGPSGLYRGYLSTVIREIPFSFIQFPIWEELKKRYSARKQKPIQPHESAICGAVAGKVAVLRT